MIKGSQKQEIGYLDKPEVNYRSIDALNQSMIKLFDTDPVKFFEQYKLGKPRKEKKSTAAILGDIADFYILSCDGVEATFDNKFDEKFALFEGNKGTGQVFLLADYLFEGTEAGLDEEGNQTLKFETRFREAFDRVQRDDKYKKKTLEYAIDDFEKNGLAYYQLLEDSMGKVVVDLSLLDKGKYVAKKLLNDEFTKDIFNVSDDKEVLTHMPIEWTYEIDKERVVKCKAEVDRLEIDHVRKVIQPDDLKTTYDNEGFDYMYIKNSYYLQNAFYFLAVIRWMQTLPELNGYQVMYPRFIVGDTSANNRRPLVYQTQKDDYSAGLYGFTYRGNYYRGIKELIDEIAWCEENNIWNCSRRSYERKGQMYLNIKYE